MQHHCSVLHLFLFNSFYKVFRFHFSVYFVPLRPLREIKITSVLFFTQRAQSAQSFISPLCFTLALEWSQTSLRQECAERLSTPSPLRGTPACLRGRKWVIALYSCNYSVRASHWGVLPSRGTEAHSVLLLKTSHAPYGREWLQPLTPSPTLYP